MADRRSTWTIERAQIDALSVTDARALRGGLLVALSRAEDDTAELFEPLLFLVEQSLMERPAVTLEALATKRWRSPCTRAVRTTRSWPL